MNALSLLVVIFLALPLTARAELMIFDMRKNLRMSENDPVYHDYYVNGGSEQGLAPGMLITVTRKLPLYDTYQNRSAGDLQLKVARVKIIHVQKGLAVARLQSEFTRENSPLLEDNYIMVGDSLDLSTAGSEKKSEAAAPPPPAPSNDKPVAQILVNSMESSSNSPSPAPVDAPTLQ